MGRKVYGCKGLKTAAVVLAVLAVFLVRMTGTSVADTSQSITSHGLTVYFGVVPAEIARGLQMGHTNQSAESKASTAKSNYHLVVAIFNAVNGERVTDATVSASISIPGNRSPEVELQPMKMADTITYGNIFEIPREGTYHIFLRIIRTGQAKPVMLDLMYEHHHP